MAASESPAVLAHLLTALAQKIQRWREDDKAGYDQSIALVCDAEDRLRLAADRLACATDPPCGECLTCLQRVIAAPTLTEASLSAPAEQTHSVVGVTPVAPREGDSGQSHTVRLKDAGYAPTSDLSVDAHLQGFGGTHLLSPALFSPQQLVTDSRRADVEAEELRLKLQAAEAASADLRAQLERVPKLWLSDESFELNSPNLKELWVRWADVQAALDATGVESAHPEDPCHASSKTS